MIQIGQRYNLKLNRDALELYYNEYKDKLHQFLDWDYEKFARHNQDFDVYGLYCDNVLIGCIYFEKVNDYFVFHVAVNKKSRGRWMFIWPRLKRWMISSYSNLLGVTHIEDADVRRLMSRAGFTFITTIDGFDWWELWEQQH